MGRSGVSTKVDEVRSTEISDKNEDQVGKIQKGSWSLWLRQVCIWNWALGPYLFLWLKQAVELRGGCVGGLAGTGRRRVEFGVCRVCPSGYRGLVGSQAYQS